MRNFCSYRVGSYLLWSKQEAEFGEVAELTCAAFMWLSSAPRGLDRAAREQCLRLLQATRRMPTGRTGSFQRADPLLPDWGSFEHSQELGGYSVGWCRLQFKHMHPSYRMLLGVTYKVTGLSVRWFLKNHVRMTGVKRRHAVIIRCKSWYVNSFCNHTF